MKTIKPLLREGQKSKIVLLVMDGTSSAGLPIEEGGKTELETARTPQYGCISCQIRAGLASPLTTWLDARQRRSTFGLYSVMTPIKFEIGRGVHSALWVWIFDLQKGDVAARGGNFCTVDENG